MVAEEGRDSSHHSTRSPPTEDSTRIGLLAELLVIVGVGVSLFLLGQALTGAPVAELWPWIIALGIVVLAIVVCRQLADHRHPNRVVATAIPSFVAVILFVIHPLLGLVLPPLLLLIARVPRWWAARQNRLP